MWKISTNTQRFKQAGGRVIVEKQEIPGYGYSVLGVDPEGNTVGLFQPMARPRPKPKKKTSSKSRNKTTKKRRK